DRRADRISLLTLHASKGLEFEVVFIAGCERGFLPLELEWTSDVSTDEECRLFFVGMTRARTVLRLSHARTRLWRGKMLSRSPSPFLESIDPALLERTCQVFKSRPKKPRAEQLRLWDHAPKG